MVAALDAPIAVGGNERERVHPWSLDRRRDDVCRLVGEPPQPVLLPGRDERTHRAQVRDGGARGGEREPPAGALEATGDGPGGGRAAPFAARTAKPWELGQATEADRRAEPAASHASTGNQKVEQHIPMTVWRKGAPVGAGSAPRV